MSGQYAVVNQVAVISIHNPPVNSLTREVRQGLLSDIARANGDAAVSAIVVVGQGPHFSAGADIEELSDASRIADTHLGTVISAIERSSKPVVAAIRGACMGGGLELALACHWRVAAPGAKLALPEVLLGVLPGAGGTQRLPRVLDVETALNLIVSGRTLTSDSCMDLPDQKLIHGLAKSEQSLLDDAVSFAQHASRSGAVHTLARDLPCQHPSGEAYFQFVRNMLASKAKREPALLECVNAVQAATRLPFEAGIAYETSLFKKLSATTESAALRHLFLAERAASATPDAAPGAVQRTIKTVGVIGAGTMGCGIAISILDAGLAVTVIESGNEALERGLTRIRSHYAGQNKKGRISAELAQQRLGMLDGGVEYQKLAHCDMVIEAVFEDLEIKKQVFRQVDQVCKADAILASNTSTLDIDEIAKILKRPQDFVGLHFFSPANIMKLLEVVKGQASSGETMACALQFAKRIRKTAVVSGVCDGFIGNRMFEQYIIQAEQLVEEGASPQQVDKAVEAFGFAMGPFRVLDLAGGDVNGAVRKYRKSLNPQLKYSPIGERLCELGRYGQKTGAGWYEYPEGSRTPQVSAAVSEIIDAARLKMNITPRLVGDAEIVSRLVLALVMEGSRILKEGIAARPGDIDVVYTTGYGFPRLRGGPMHYAKTSGWPAIARELEKFAASASFDPLFWDAALLKATIEA